MTALEQGLLIAVAAAIAGAVASAYIAGRASTEGVKPLGNGATPSDNSGSAWTNTGENNNLQMTPQTTVYNGPGRQHTRASANGAIFAQKFHKGGNPNSPTNHEQSYAIQTSTKNPFANGTNNSYARAVNNATQDPTNQATALVLGPGIAPNDD
jgi:hypothetical protein